VTDFHIDWEANRATCPRGKESGSWRTYQDKAGASYIKVRFPAADCQACEARTQCTKATGAEAGRQLRLHPRDQHEALIAARAREASAGRSTPCAKASKARCPRRCAALAYAAPDPRARQDPPPARCHRRSPRARSGRRLAAGAAPRPDADLTLCSSSCLTLAPAVSRVRHQNNLAQMIYQQHPIV